MENGIKTVTITNAGNCTAYELRQELVRRDAFDLPEDKVNFKSLLQRVVGELVKEQEQKDASKLQETVSVRQTEKELAKQERERRKQEAMERSRQRQLADPEYFKRKSELNTPPAPLAISSTAVDDINTTADGDTEGESMEPAEFDPFRTTKKSSKVFMR